MRGVSTREESLFADKDNDITVPLLLPRASLVLQHLCCNMSEDSYVFAIGNLNLALIWCAGTPY